MEIIGDILHCGDKEQTRVRIDDIVDYKLAHVQKRPDKTI